MSKRGPRPVHYVCIGSDLEKAPDFVSRSIQAVSQTEAASFFFEQTGMKAKVVHGPFRLKREQVLENTRTLKFAPEQKPALYNGWEVVAHFLKEPENHAFLVFLKRVDGKKMPAPKTATVVPISDLRFPE